MTNKIKLPRRLSPASYSVQLVTLNVIFGSWWRRFSLCLFGIGWCLLSEANTLPVIGAASVQQRHHEPGCKHMNDVLTFCPSSVHDVPVQRESFQVATTRYDAFSWRRGKMQSSPLRLNRLFFKPARFQIGFNPRQEYNNG